MGRWKPKTHAYVAVHRNGKYAAGYEDNRLLDMMHEVDQCGLVARLGVHPVGLEYGVGQIVGVVDEQVAGVAEGECLQQDGNDEQERGYALPEVRKEENVDQSEAQNGANQQELDEDGAGNDGSYHVTAPEG